MNGLKIRSIGKEDTPKMVNLMYQYIVDFYRQPSPCRDDLTNLVHHLIDNPGSGLQFAAEKDDNLIGFATLYFTFSTLKVKKQAILNDLFVITEMRGQHIGEKLFNTCLSHIRDNDFSSMEWETAKDNYTAQALYDKMGGKLTDWIHYEMK